MVFCFTIHKIEGSILESIVWLIFSKYSLQKIVLYFPCSEQNFENS